jgi:hypothetical protein
LRAVAAAYLLGVWLEGVGWGSPQRAILPHWLAFFMQCAALFPRAAHYSIDYRAEAYVCDTGQWQELDVRPYFQIDVNDKESRFQRALFFYRRQKVVMNALERFLIEVHNHEPQNDGIPDGAKIGGVRMLSIRGPLPEIGAPLVRVHWTPLAEIPMQERKQWYQTKSSKIAERCEGRRPRGVRPTDRPSDEERVGHTSEEPTTADPTADPRKEEQP